MNSEDSANEMHDNPDPETTDCHENVDEVPEDMEEFANVDEALDQIGTYLDQLEEKNDSIYARLQDLLESNRQTRKEMEAERLAGQNPAETSANTSDTNPPGKSDSTENSDDKDVMEH